MEPRLGERVRIKVCVYPGNCGRHGDHMGTLVWKGAPADRGLRKTSGGPVYEVEIGYKEIRPGLSHPLVVYARKIEKASP